MENNKFKYFLQNAYELNEKFGIVPLLYGSLGLEVLTGSNLNSDDIDILIPEKYLEGEEWEKFKQYFLTNGYDLIDEDEHNFIKYGISYSYASIENLKPFAGISLEEIKHNTINNVQYLLLSLEQYLKVYEKSSQDGYRMNVKEKQDNKKIEFIKDRIKGEIHEI